MGCLGPAAVAALGTKPSSSADAMLATYVEHLALSEDGRGTLATATLPVTDPTALACQSPKATNPRTKKAAPEGKGLAAGTRPVPAV